MQSPPYSLHSKEQDPVPSRVPDIDPEGGPGPPHAQETPTTLQGHRQDTRPREQPRSDGASHRTA